ncbi:TauD/TfdA family dioxygenase [Mycobacterium sp. pW049]|uniref:TauD/TfdA family dioxygenase n=1 Tax=[Mycobacterium] bulgaricum TaxID=3238985 RepID=UPI00351B3CB2
MTAPISIDIGDGAHQFAEVAERICPSSEVNALRRPAAQHVAVRRLAAEVPQARDVIKAMRTDLTETGAVVLRNAPVCCDTLLVLLGAAVAPAITSEVYPDLVDQVTPNVTGEEQQRAQNQRSEMLLHTDASAQQSPPDILGLACVANEGHGGASLLLAIDDAVDTMKAADQVLEQLRAPFPFVHPQHQDKPAVLAPVVTRRTSGGGYRIRYRKENLQTGLSLAGDHITADQRTALDTLADCLESGTRTMRFRLSPDDYLLFDNTRYLHGRTEIEHGARRLVKRTYFRHTAEAGR